MRLAEFIQANHKNIIDHWVQFAASMGPWADGMSRKDLEDHAAQLLTAVVSDMNTPQSGLEQSEKSKGNAAEGLLSRVGQRHATERLETGLDLQQLVSEFRALRASVLRLWEKAHGEEQDEVTRFNEAIDEILSSSTSRYAETVQNTQEQFLGILGHDLRNPLGAVTMGAELLMESADAGTVELATLIFNSGQRMSRMVNDLLDLTRTRLGAGIPVKRKPLDLAPVCRLVISELRAVHPDRDIRFVSSGDLRGEWDSDRLAQVVSNLVANALQYGSSDGSVSVVAEERGDEIALCVHNDGPPIPENAARTIFMPMARHQPGGQAGDKNSTGLGLGLFIANEIVMAHDGTISMSSSRENGTTFTVTAPRRPAVKPRR